MIKSKIQIKIRIAYPGHYHFLLLIFLFVLIQFIILILIWAVRGGTGIASSISLDDVYFKTAHSVTTRID